MSIITLPKECLVGIRDPLLPNFIFIRGLVTTWLFPCLPVYGSAPTVELSSPCVWLAAVSAALGGTVGTQGHIPRALEPHVRQPALPFVRNVLSPERAPRRQSHIPHVPRAWDGLREPLSRGGGQGGARLGSGQHLKRDLRQEGSQHTWKALPVTGA